MVHVLNYYYYNLVARAIQDNGAHQNTTAGF